MRSISQELKAAWLAAALLAGLMLLLGEIIFVWDWGQLRNILLPVGAVVALPLAVCRMWLHDRQVRTSELTHALDIYSRATEKIASEHLVIRLAGLDELWALAQQQPGRYHVKIMTLLCRFLRRPMPLTETSYDSRLARWRPDLQAALDLIKRRSAAQRAAERDQPADGEAGPWRLNLRAANLHGADMRGGDLCGAVLRDANLHGVDLTGAVLCGADLRRVDLKGAELRCADLSDARLSGADLHGVDLSDARLRCADLRGADLRGADLRCADLRGANVLGAHLSDADLRGVRLSGARLKRADLQSAVYDEKDLAGACWLNEAA